MNDSIAAEDVDGNHVGLVDHHGLAINRNQHGGAVDCFNILTIECHNHLGGCIISNHVIGEDRSQGLSVGKQILGGDAKSFEGGCKRVLIGSEDRERPFAVQGIDETGGLEGC